MKTGIKLWWYNTSFEHAKKEKNQNAIELFTPVAVAVSVTNCYVTLKKSTGCYLL